jgi:hypothetical protein
MPDTAYAFFFVAVLLGSAVALFLSLIPELPKILAALRAELPEEAEAEPSFAHVNVWERHQPILQPVSISICRI